MPVISPLSMAAWSIRSIAAAPLASSVGNLADADEGCRATNTGNNQISITTMSNRFDISFLLRFLEPGSEHARPDIRIDRLGAALLLWMNSTLAIVPNSSGGYGRMSR